MAPLPFILLRSPVLSRGARTALLAILLVVGPHDEVELIHVDMCCTGTAAELTAEMVAGGQRVSRLR